MLLVTFFPLIRSHILKVYLGYIFVEYFQRRYRFLQIVLNMKHVIKKYCVQYILYIILIKKNEVLLHFLYMCVGETRAIALVK